MTARKTANDIDFDGQHTGKNVAAPTPGSTEIARIVDVETASTADRDRGNHTGSQPASSISNFDTAVRLNRLDQLAAPTGPVGMNGQKITGLGTPTSGTDAATKAYVDTAVGGIASGLIMKGAVRAVASVNVSVTAAPATIDGVTPAAGDIFWLNAQTTGTENGPRIWNSAGTAMPRAANWDTDAEAVLGSFWVVKEGTAADLFAVLINDTAITLGTSVPSVVVRGEAGSTEVSGYATNVGNASAVAFTVTHGLGTEDVIVAVRRVAAPKDFIDVYARVIDANSVSVEPDAVWGASEFRVLVRKVI